VFGAIGFPGYVAYSTTKFALRGFTEALRRELAGSSVTVQYLAPRATRTPINSSAVERMNAELGVAMDPPERVARELAELLRTGRRSAVVGWPEKLFVRINAAAGARRPFAAQATTHHSAFRAGQPGRAASVGGECGPGGRSEETSHMNIDISTRTRAAARSTARARITPRVARAFALAIMFACVLVLSLGAQGARAADDPMAAELLDIQHAWEKANYETPDASAKKASLEALSQRAEGFVRAHPGRAEPLVWQGIAQHLCGAARSERCPSLCVARQPAGRHEAR
jgi:hypothetical protein